jgi:hypothetical protein
MCRLPSVSSTFLIRHRIAVPIPLPLANVALHPSHRNTSFLDGKVEPTVPGGPHASGHVCPAAKRMKRRLARMCAAWRVRIRADSGVALLLLKVAAELGVVLDIDVGIALSDDPHNVDVVGELDEAECFGEVAGRERKEERNEDAEPEERRTEEVVRVSTAQ